MNARKAVIFDETVLGRIVERIRKYHVQERLIPVLVFVTLSTLGCFGWLGGGWLVSRF